MKVPLLIMLSIAFHSQLGNGLERKKRYLLYSVQGSKLQLIFGTGVPIHLENMSATIGWIIKSAYLLPTNASIYTDPYGSLGKPERKRSVKNRSMNRYDLYRAFEKRVLSFHSAGKDCLLKAICEASTIPFRGSGLAGQLLSVFFLPSTTEELPETGEDREYSSAETPATNKGSNCGVRYPTCNLHLIDLLTTVL